MSNELKIEGGLNLVPKPTFPITPTEGTLFSSDGTINPIGLYQFLAGTWVPVGAQSLIDPRNVPIANSTFDSGITGITHSVVSLTSSITHETTNPLAGVGSLRINSITQNSLANVITTPLTLSGLLQENQIVNIAFELHIVQSSVPPTNPFGQGFGEGIQVKLVDLDNSSAQVGATTLAYEASHTNSVGSTRSGPPVGSVITSSVDIITSGETNLELQLLCFTAHEVNNASTVVYVIKNIKITTKGL